MGRCNFGFHKANGVIYPLIEIKTGASTKRDGEVETISFISKDVSFSEEDIEEARKFITGVYLVLTGEQGNLRYHAGGQLDS